MARRRTPAERLLAARERLLAARERRIAEQERVIHFADSLPVPAPERPALTVRVEGADMMAEVARGLQEQIAVALHNEMQAETERLITGVTSIMGVPRGLMAEDARPAPTWQPRGLPVLEGHDATARLDTWFGEYNDRAPAAAERVPATAEPRRRRSAIDDLVPDALSARYTVRQMRDAAGEVLTPVTLSEVALNREQQRSLTNAAARDNWIARAISAGYTPARHESRDPTTRERLAEHARMSMNDRNLHHTMRLFMRVAELPPEQTTGDREELAVWMRGQQAHRLVDWLATMFGAMMLDGDRLREMLRDMQDREFAAPPEPAPPARPRLPKLPAHARGIKLPKEGADD